MFCDLSLIYKDSGCDLSLLSGDLAGDTTLYTAVLISLFTDALAEPHEELPAGENDRQGWWGDFLNAENSGSGSALPKNLASRKIGSKLWLLRREKSSPAVLARAEQYAKEALAWLKEDKLVSDVSVKANREGLYAFSLAVSLTVLPASLSRRIWPAYEQKEWTFFYNYSGLSA